MSQLSSMLRSTALNSTRCIRSTTAIQRQTNLLLSRSSSILPVTLTSQFHTSSRWLAANPQSGKPASDNLSHTVKNIKQEAGQVASSIESAIGGQGGSGAQQNENESGASGTSELLRDAKSITAEMAQKVPQPALLWGAAGE